MGETQPQPTELPTSGLPNTAAAPEPADAPESNIVIQPRKRLWLTMFITPLLVVAAAVAIMGYRIQSPDWRGWTVFRKSLARTPVRLPRDGLPNETPVVSPDLQLKVIQAKPSDAGSTAPGGAQASVQPGAGQSSDSAEPKAEQNPLTSAYQGSPGEAVPAGAAVDTPGASPLEEIQREADRLRAERLALEKIKERQVEQNELSERDQRDQRVQRLLSIRMGIEQDRASFRAGLKKILDAPGPKPGASILRLCSEHEMPSLVPGMADPGRRSTALAATPSRELVERLRLMGMSEAEILLEIARIEERNKVARKGPRTTDEVLLRASRSLLSIPVSARPELAKPAAARRPARSSK